MGNRLTWCVRVAGLAAVAAFAVLVGRFWHPYFGFTMFLQVDEPDWHAAIPELRTQAVYHYPGHNGYDGTAYVQIAFHPSLDSADLQKAVGNVPYRARRILGSALAWVLAGGGPDGIAHIYAGLNLAVWLALAAILWRILSVSDWHGWIAWAGVLFSAGALHSVRLALTDLLAVTLLAAAMLLAGQRRGALVTLAFAGLARETVLASVVAFWRGPWNSRRAWLGNALRTIVVAAPLVAWMLYVRWKAGPADQGFGNFTWPMAGWMEKWGAAFSGFRRDPGFLWLNTTTLLATIGLSAQALFILRRICLDDSWWRMGAAGLVLMGSLGTSVWEGHPGAATRVLLPMSLAFAVLAVRQRANAAWLCAGALTVFSGVQALWNVPHDPLELAAGRLERGGVYIVRLGDGWFGRESNRWHAWAWAERRGALMLEVRPQREERVRIRLALRVLGPRAVRISQEGTVLWQGTVGIERKWIEFETLNLTSGLATLDLASDEAGIPENSSPEARALGFAVYDLEVR